MRFALDAMIGEDRAFRRSLYLFDADDIFGGQRRQLTSEQALLAAIQFLVNRVRPYNDSACQKKRLV
ncbi:MAG TPA: hypothetical protein VGF38_09105 [Ktedonobacterales bacterium]|jgi:hypothetical protein